MVKHPERAAERGFSLIELMIVVLIVAILSAIALPLFMRSRYRSYALEATETLGKIAAAQESYRAEFNVYSDVSNDPTLGGLGEGSTGGLGAWWPALGTPAAGPGGMTSFYSGMSASWNQLGARPRDRVRYSYQTIAGLPGVAPAVGASGDLGYAALPAAQRGIWYYATASGDLDANGVYSRFEISSITRGVNVIGSDVE